MIETIIATIISSAFTLAGVIITVLISSAKNKAIIEQKVNSQQAQIEEMKEDIKEHNNYAIHIPVIETEIKNIKETLSEIKKISIRRSLIDHLIKPSFLARAL